MRLIDAVELKRSISVSVLIKDQKTLEQIIDEQPTIEERKKGKWVEKHHAYCDEKSGIEEWQSCQCSECGRYDTRPYLYYFEEPHFCSWCGADMRGEEDGERKQIQDQS